MERSLRDFVEIDALMHMGRVIELGCRADREPRMRVQTVELLIQSVRRQSFDVSLFFGETVACKPAQFNSFAF